MGQGGDSASVKAIIAGAGIGGLATGIALRRAGLDVEIFERASELREIGAGLMIWPNGMRSLQALGVEVRTLAVDRITLGNSRGKRLTDLPVDGALQRYGANVSFVHRADLQAALAKTFGREGLHLACDVRGFIDEESRVEVTLRDGTVANGDFLVGADGLRSSVRRQLLADGEPIYLGSTVWRGLARGEGIALPIGDGMNWWGRGSEFVAFHLADGSIYWAAVTKKPRGEEPGPDGHKQDVFVHFGTWAQPVPALIAATPDAAILRNDMYDRPAARHWSRGRVTLVGDAAHPMTPNQGQGACQALDDAVALGESVKRTSTLADTFQQYERRRLRRANRVVAMSHQATRGIQLDNPLLCAIRDGFVKLLPRRWIVRTQDATLAPDVSTDG
jgi:2-polyprenyl-6-methoxyphenol hydroxylase-like FAD-dependent oxidoreductase